MKARSHPSFPLGSNNIGSTKIAPTLYRPRTYGISIATESRDNTRNISQGPNKNACSHQRLPYLPISSNALESLPIVRPISGTNHTRIRGCSAFQNASEREESTTHIVPNKQPRTHANISRSENKPDTTMPARERTNKRDISGSRLRPHAHISGLRLV
jgi:hypothetical protein